MAIRHYNDLKNPITQTRVMDVSEFVKYIRLAELSEWFPVGDDAKGKRVDEIRKIFYDTHTNIVKTKLDEVWGFVKPMVEKNAALARFILDYGGAVSDFFFPWLMSIVKSPSEALEMAYGAGYDICGMWFSMVPENDKIMDFVHNVPTFVYQRERQLFMADLVLSSQDRGSKQYPTTVVDLGAGRVPWARYHGFQCRSQRQKILAIDKDPSINVEELFARPDLFGIEYQKADILPWLATTDARNVDLVMLGGVASYVPLPVFTEAMVKPVYNILGADGSFFFDLQLECPQYEWTIKLFGWPEMKLARSAAEAISQVEEVRRQLWDAGMKFNAEYHVDTACANPSAVMIVFQKQL